jgi:isopentenyldiphosphate isomerase
MHDVPTQIVDEHDNPLRGGTKDEVQFGALWHQIARVMVFDEQGKVLLQRLPEDSFYYQNCWNTTVSGHVDEGEDYLGAALREGEEEVGVTFADLEEVDYYAASRVDGDRTYNRFNKTFKAVVMQDVQFEPAADEVAELKWFTQSELKSLVAEYPDRVTDGLADFVAHVLT